jgi:PAS domain S-box-containing protein
MKLTYRWCLFCFLLILLVSSPAFAQTAAQPADLVVLRDGQDKYPLGRHLEILRDPSGELTFQDVTSADYQNQFILSQVESPNFGFQKAVYWVRFRVRNQVEQNSSWVLELGFINMHYVDLFLPSGDGASYEVKQSGVLRPYANRDIPFRRLAFNLNVPSGNEQTVYLRFQNQASMTLPLVLWSRDAFTGYMLRDQLINGLLTGALIIMALYNLMLWYLIRERSYLYLVLFITSQLVANIFYRGTVYQFVQIRSPRLATTSLLVFLGLEIFFILRFFSELLDLKTNSPKLHWGSQFFGAALLLTVLLAPFGSYQLIGETQLILGIILFTAIAIVTLYFLWAGSRPARFLLLSWVFFIIAGIIFAFTRLGLLSSTPFTEESTEVAMVWMVAVWSLALADRVNTLKGKAEATSRQLRESETRYRRLVETMNEGLGVSNEGDRFTYVNPRLAEMLGYSVEEMNGRPVVEFFDTENRKIIEEQLTRRRRGEEETYTITWCRKDGCDLHTLVAPAAVFDQAGKFLRSIAVVTDISEQVRARQLLDRRVAERTLELETLLDVSQVVVSTLELEPLLQVILEELRSVVDFEGAAIYSIGDRHLSTLNFPLLVAKEKAILLAQPLIQEISRDERVMRTEAFMIADIQADTEDARYFRRIGADFLDFNTGKMHSWMGIPLKFKDQLIGVLSVHHSQVGYYTPKDARLAFAFANQAAVAIENAGLYRKAQAVATAEERSRLARELHDSVTQALYSLTLYAGATRAALHAGKLEAAEKNLDEVIAVAREGMGDLRLLIFELRPPVLEQEGLISALQTRLETVETRAGIKTEFNVQGQPNLSSEMETELYWSLYEALNNVLKHARAKHVYLDLHFSNGWAAITLRDDGVGFDASTLDQSNGMGLKNIADRIGELGGNFKIESGLGQGTVFEIKLGE